LLHKIRYHFYFLLVLVVTNAVHAQNIETDVLVIGGGASGVSAGLQAGRLGVKTIIVEPTTWLGGMVTAAGVSAFDGNHDLPSGIFGEFRNKLYQVYGNPEKVSTGWVSMTLFEPHVGDSIFKKLVASVPALQVLYSHQFVKVLRNGNTVTGALFTNKQNNQVVTIHAKQVIDATELGDVFADAGVPYDLGMEASTVSGENVGVEKSSDIIQDLTYTAILKDYGVGQDKTIAKPAGYDPAEFDGSCTDYYIDKSRKKPSVDSKKMLDYGKLPNNKYMINWPIYGNDIYLNLVEMDEAARQTALIKAKEQTLRFVYFIQHQLGYKHFGFADDEFPTADQFPLIPYYREGRRVKGLVRFNIKHIAKPFDGDMHLNRTGIAVGDYPIDHHHKKNASAPQHLDFYPVPSFNIPLGAIIPDGYNGLIVAEKGISVSNVVNGTTRLQPAVILIGQAAGTLAALSVLQSKNASAISVRAVQQSLLKSGAFIMPYCDVPVTHPDFLAAQKIGATDILKGEGVPYNWANKTLFHPDSLVDAFSLAKDLEIIFKIPYKVNAKKLFIEDALKIVSHISKVLSEGKTNEQFENNLRSIYSKQYKKEQALTRIQFAKLLDETVHPFEKMDVNHKGNFKQSY
jgi:hypothetical protein